MKTLPLIISLLLSLAGAARAASLEEAQSMAGEILKNGGAQAAVATVRGRPVMEMTALQKHVSFFDKNGDGIITRYETGLGLRQLGLGRLKAGAGALVIHVFLGPQTSGSWKNLGISVKDIKLGRHGSDTGVFDAEGRFVPEAFERIFVQFDANHSGSMSAAELEAMIEANSKLRPGNKSASSVEFRILLLIAADAAEDAGAKRVRAISKSRLKEFYDGTLFYALAKPEPAPRSAF